MRFDARPRPCPRSGGVLMIAICNMALGYLGEPSIASIDERRPSAEYCKLYYRHALELVLREHPWNFAQARERLTPAAMPEGWSGVYAYAYVKPKKCVLLHFLMCEGGRKSVCFETVDVLDRTLILCNLDEAFAHFTRYIDDTGKYDTHFTQAVARKLQTFLVKPLLKSSASLLQEAETLYQRALEAARLRDAGEGRRFQDASANWNGGHDLWGDAVQRECGR